MRDALNECCMKLYTGTEPATADAPATGTLLATITANAATWTGESYAVGSLTLGGTAGSITQFLVNGTNYLSGLVITFDTSLAKTAALTVGTLNAIGVINTFRFSYADATIIVTALPSYLAASYNTQVVSGAFSGGLFAASSSALAGGVTGANGLRFGMAAAGQLSKLSTQVWSGAIVATGTATYFRLITTSADTGQADIYKQYNRVQGNIGTSAAALILPNTTLSTGLLQTITSFKISI